jgi:hypothetical protein
MMHYKRLTEYREVRAGADGKVVSCRSHLTLVLCIVQQACLTYLQNITYSKLIKKIIKSWFSYTLLLF